LYLATCYWNNAGIWFNDREKDQSDVIYQIHNWYHFLWLCGDHICEQHVHNLDVCNWVFGEHPITAAGVGGRSQRPTGEAASKGNIWDHFAIEYTYKSGKKMMSFCRHQPGTWNPVEEHIYGSKGTCKMRDGLWEINGKKCASDSGPERYVQEHIDLIQSIRSGKLLNELQAVTESTMTAIMGRMAAYTNTELTWEQAVNSKLDTFPKNLTAGMALPVAPVPEAGRNSKFS
jgi:myo-inositol 2-dehydrogenase / D-chiro-inositol 1-dehydrogenase